MLKDTHSRCNFCKTLKIHVRKKYLFILAKKNITAVRGRMFRMITSIDEVVR